MACTERLRKTIEEDSKEVLMALSRPINRSHTYPFPTDFGPSHLSTNSSQIQDQPRILNPITKKIEQKSKGI